MRDSWIERLRPTMEQEGWIITIDHWNSFKKGNVVGILISAKDDNYRIEIILQDILLDERAEQSSNGRLYLGYCKDGEDFKAICKLLGI